MKLMNNYLNVIFVYGISCELGIIYIGSTNDINRRYQYHNSRIKTGNTKLYNFLRNNDYEYEFKILDQRNCVLNKERQLFEQIYIDKYKPILNTNNAMRIKSKKEYNREYAQSPKIKNYKKEYNKKYQTLDKSKEYRKNYEQTEKRKEYKREYSQKRKFKRRFKNVLIELVKFFGH